MRARVSVCVCAITSIWNSEAAAAAVCCQNKMQNMPYLFNRRTIIKPNKNFITNVCDSPRRRIGPGSPFYLSINFREIYLIEKQRISIKQSTTTKICVSPKCDLGAFGLPGNRFAAHDITAITQGWNFQMANYSSHSIGLSSIH